MVVHSSKNKNKLLVEKVNLLKQAESFCQKAATSWQCT